MTEQDDATDVERTLAGDTEAFGRIVERWQARLVTLAFRFCGDRWWAEDLAQAAFVRAFRRLSQWRGRGPFGGWLVTVATNLYRSRLRRRRPGPEPLDAVAALTASASPAEERDDSRAVREAVSRLPARYRDVLVLFYFHDSDVRATAATLGLPEGTVKARLSRGRALLRADLGPRFETDS